MPGVVVCHGSAAIRERIALTAQAVPALLPVRTAGSVEELVLHARRQAPSIVLLDAHLPGVGPIEAIRRLALISIRVAVVMLAQAGDEVALDRAVALGARGFLAPDVGRAELAAVAAHIYADVSVNARVGMHTRTTDRDPAAVLAPIGTRPMSRVPQQNGQRPIQLTQRELEVLAGMSQGRSNAQIGADLFLSEDTVKTHARRLFRKMEAADRAQAVAIGLRRGLIN